MSQVKINIWRSKGVSFHPLAANEPVVIKRKCILIRLSYDKYIRSISRILKVNIFLDCLAVRFSDFPSLILEKVSFVSFVKVSLRDYEVGHIKKKSFSLHFHLCQIPTRKKMCDRL